MKYIKQKTALKRFFVFCPLSAAEALAVGALAFTGIGFMSANSDVVKAAVVFCTVVISTAFNITSDIRIYIFVHFCTSRKFTQKEKGKIILPF